jgi:hypothetical protein
MPKVGQQPSLSQQSPPQSRIPCQLLALQKPPPAIPAAPFGMQKTPSQRVGGALGHEYAVFR